MTYRAVITTALVNEHGEDELIEFHIDLPHVPQIDSTLTFEAAPTDTKVDVLRMEVTMVETHWSLVGEEAPYRSVPVVEITTELLDDGVTKKYASGADVAGALKLHAERVNYPV